MTKVLHLKVSSELRAAIQTRARQLHVSPPELMRLALAEKVAAPFGPYSADKANGLDATEIDTIKPA